MNLDQITSIGVASMLFALVVFMVASAIGILVEAIKTWRDK